MAGVLGLRNEIGRKHGIRRSVHLTAASCGSGVTPAKPGNLSLRALYTVLAMLGFAGMDAMSKWLIADYAIGQLMWIRYGVFCLFAWVFVLAFRYLPLADTHAVAATSPLIVIALGVLFLRERAGPARWLAVGAGFLGVLLIVRPGFRALDWPLVLPLLGAVMWGGYQILTRLSQRTDSPDTTLVWSAFAAFAATTLAAPWGWQWPDAQGWALMIVAALLGAIANYALIRALDYAEASAVQPYSYTLLVWVTILGAVVFGDIPDHWTLAGALIIVASGLYTWHHDRRMSG